MKRMITLFSAISLGLNFVLLAVILTGRTSAPEPVVASQDATKPTPSARSAIGEETWSNLHTDDLPAMVERLRTQGFPPEIVRAMLMAQLREFYIAREKALDPDSENRPFWKNYSIDPRVQTARMQLYREQQKKMRELLGPDAEPKDNINALYQGRRFDTVPPEKVDDVQRLLREFEDARNDLFSNAGGGMIGNETQKRLAALEKDQRAALGRVLTPQELEDWEVRNSDTSRSVRNELTAFNPTEAEFRAIYKLRATYDEQFGRMFGPSNQDEMQRRNDAHRQMTEQIKATLGGERAAEYDRANEYSYRQTSQLVARLELPAATTNQVYEIQKDITQKIRTAYSPGQPQADGDSQRTQQLAQLASEAETRITAILGARGFEAYKQYGGSWMQSLRPRPDGIRRIP